MQVILKINDYYFSQYNIELSLKEENAKIKSETEAKLAAMQEQVSALLATVAKPKTRKPKVVEA